MFGNEIYLKPFARLRQRRRIKSNIPLNLIVHFPNAHKLIDLGLKARNRIWNVGGTSAFAVAGGSCTFVQGAGSKKTQEKKSTRRAVA